MDVHEKLDELSSLVEEARSMPMSASCIVNRAELLGLLEELRELLPEEFRHAQLLLDDREAVVEEGRRETHVAQITFVLRGQIPNAVIPVNPLGLTITYFRVDQAFK